MSEEAVNGRGPSRVILWGTPRCLSTAFLKEYGSVFTYSGPIMESLKPQAMTYVEDSLVWHEPYLYARRLGPDGADRDKFQKQMTKIMVARGINVDAVMAMVKSLPFGYEAANGSYQWIKDQLEADAPGKKLIFSKDMVEGIVGRFDALPNGFRHTFLLRNPLKVFPSFKRMAEGGFLDPNGDLRTLTEDGLMPKGYFYKELHELYEYVKDNKLDSKPIIICTDDLQRNPEGIIKAYCKELKIPFNEKLLKWEDDGEEIMQKWMVPKEIAIGLKDIHKNAFQSTGFGEPSDLPDKSDLDEDVIDIIDKCMPYYKEMHKERLQVE